MKQQNTYGLRQRATDLVDHILVGDREQTDFLPAEREAYESRITRETVQRAYQMLQDYKRGKQNLDEKIVSNEQWYKMRHWEQMRKKNIAVSDSEKKKPDGVEPSSAWLFNAIMNKHADAMDNFPSANILPREEGDKNEAEMLSSIIPVILDQCGFEQTYSDVWNYKLKNGTGVYGIFWDGSLLNGLGDISIRKVDVLRLFWEPGITDIQDSRNLFVVDFIDRDLLKEMYPDHVANFPSAESGDVSRYIYDDDVDISKKCMVVDWYYKKNQGGKTVLHYCKFSGTAVLYATENETTPIMNARGEVIAPAPATAGLYNHGRYPFEFDVLFPIEGSPAGYSYIDVGKSAQEYIDHAGRAIMRNMLVGAKPRVIVKNSSGLNEEEFCDTECDVVHADSVSEDSVIPIQVTQLDSTYLSVLESKIEELKEVTGCKDVMTGGSSSGATAASAIAALQEAGSKQSRDIIKASYRAFRGIVLQIVELIRQFYDLSRKFRILGQNGAVKFVQYSNAGIKPQTQGMELGVEAGPRVPLFDIEITAQKKSPYSRMSQNELALQFYNAGFFLPQNADNALAALEMMDFDRKSFVQERVAQNGTMYQKLMAMQQNMMMLARIVDADHGTNYTAMMGGAQVSGQSAVMPPDEKKPTADGQERLGDDEGTAEESSVTKKARERTAEATAPR